MTEARGERELAERIILAVLPSDLDDPVDRRSVTAWIEGRLAAALDAARAQGREEGQQKYNDSVAESTLAVLIPHDTDLAERFLHDFNQRRKATP